MSARLRFGDISNTARGALRVVEELMLHGRARWSQRITVVARGLGVLERPDEPHLLSAGWTYSIGLRWQTQKKTAIVAIREADSEPPLDLPETGRGTSHRRCSATNG